jgi:hypothetical protein
MTCFCSGNVVADQLVGGGRRVYCVDGESWRKQAPGKLSCWACEEGVFEGFWLLIATGALLDLLPRPVGVGGKVRLS